MQRRTLFVRNLDSSIRPTELRRSVFLMFSEYGRVIDVIVSPGQAFVSMDTVDAAGEANRNLDGFEAFGRKLTVQFARVPSASVDPAVAQERKDKKRLAMKAPR